MSDMLPRPEPREPFRRALRAQLMAQAATTLVRRDTVWSRLQAGWMRPALALATVAALLLGSTGKAAADSLPGDAAYPLKRAAEQVQLVFALDDSTRLRALAEQADHRIAELAASIASRRPAATAAAQQEYTDAVAQLTKQVEAIRGQRGVSEDKKNEAEDIVDGVHLKHAAVLQQLEQRGNADDHQDIEQAKEASDKLHPSDRPARTAEPADKPERSRSPQPGRTANPGRTPTPSRSPDKDSGADHQPEGTPTQTPSVRR